MRVDETELHLKHGRRLKLGDSPPYTLESLNNLIELYKAWNKPEKTDEWRAELAGHNDAEKQE